MPVQRKPTQRPPEASHDGAAGSDGASRDRIVPLPSRALAPLEPPIGPAAKGCADMRHARGADCGHEIRPVPPRPEDPPHLKVAHEGDILKVALKRRPTAKRITLARLERLRRGRADDPRADRPRHRPAFRRWPRRWIAARLAKVPDPGAVRARRAGALARRAAPDRPLVQHQGRHAGHERQRRAARSSRCPASAAHVARRVRDFLEGGGAARFRRPASNATRPPSACRPSASPCATPESRWGSCSASGALSFSWRLIMAPPFVLDYLAAHEVAHLRELNHSPSFLEASPTNCAPAPKRRKSGSRPMAAPCTGSGEHRRGHRA